MEKTNSLKIDINNASDEWYKPEVDKKILKNLSQRSDFEGWKHIIIFFTSLSFLGIFSSYFWGTWWFLLF